MLGFSGAVVSLEDSIVEISSTTFRNNTSVSGGGSIFFLQTEASINNSTFLYRNIPNVSDVQCAFNRSGLLCGSCKDGLSLILRSSHCQVWSNSGICLLIAFGLAGIALVVFLLCLNLTVAIGTVNGLIFYANFGKANRTILFSVNNIIF